MRIQTESSITHETAWYIMDANGWKHREGMDGMEYIQSVREDEFGNFIEFNRITKKIKIKREMHAQELLAALKILRVI